MKKTILSIALVGTIQSQGMTTLFSDDFSDGNRDGWFFFTSGSADSEVAGNAYRFNTSGSSNGAAISYFTPATLSIGQTLTFSFQVSTSNASVQQGNSLRFGIFNSGGTTSRISTDLTVSNDTAFNNDVGYAGFHSFQGPNIEELRRRNSGSSNTFWTNSAYSALATGSASTGNNSNDTFYTASIVLDYTAADSMTVSSSFGSVTRTNTVTSPITTFDAVSVFADGNNGALTIDNVLVTVVPEPSSILLGAIGSLCLLRRRR